MSAQAFRYRGYDARGQKVEGEVLAASLEEAERRISAKDVTPTAIQPIAARSTEKKKASGTTPRVGGKVSDGEAATILRNVAVMIESGVPFLEALEGSSAGARPAARTHIERLREEVVGGKSVSQGMKAVPDLFPPIVADMVRVAEEGGRLDRALASAAAYLERASEFRKRVMNAMLYPAVMIGVSTITVLVLVIFVMPRFANIFQKMKIDLPWTTRTILALGDAARSHPAGALATIGGLVAASVTIRRVPAARSAFRRFVGRIPVLGPLLRQLAVSRAFSSIATLLSANVSVMAALEQGAGVAGEPVIAHALLDARGAVEHGGTLFDSLTATGAFPPVILQMVAVGERTGRLHALLAAAAARMEEEVDARLKALVAMIEPLMIVVMGAIVGTITVSIITPIYSVVEHIK